MFFLVALRGLGAQTPMFTDGAVLGEAIAHLRPAWHPAAPQRGQLQAARAEVKQATLSNPLKDW